MLCKIFDLDFTSSVDSRLDDLLRVKPYIRESTAFLVILIQINPDHSVRYSCFAASSMSNTYRKGPRRKPED